MYRIVGSFSSLIGAALICSLPAFALDKGDAGVRAGGDAAAICEVGGYLDHPMLLAAYTDTSPGRADARRADHDTAGQNTAGKNTAGQNTAGQNTAGQNTAAQNTAGDLDSPPSAHPRRSPGAGEAPPDTVLSLFHPSPRPPQVAARTVGDEQPGDWVRMSESTVPEPGLWALLIAGFLGVCAMARPRIFSS